MSTNTDEKRANAKRQKTLYERRRANGWRQKWVDPGTIQLAKRLKGIENIAERFTSLEAELDRSKKEVQDGVNLVSQMAKLASDAGKEAQVLKEKAEALEEKTTELSSEAEKLRTELNALKERGIWETLRAAWKGFGKSN